QAHIFRPAWHAGVRSRQSQEDPQTMLKYAGHREKLADLAVESLNTNVATKRRWFWLIPAIFGVSAVAVIAALYMAIASHRSRKDTLQLKAEIARLNYGLGQQSEMFRRAEQTRSSIDAQTRSDSAARDSLKPQPAAL